MRDVMCFVWQGKILYGEIFQYIFCDILQSCRKYQWRAQQIFASILKIARHDFKYTIIIVTLSRNSLNPFMASNAGQYVGDGRACGDMAMACMWAILTICKKSIRRLLVQAAPSP
jgi:hypothetical protein